MSKRYLEDSITIDGTVCRLSDRAFRIFILMLSRSDDFGILPCDIDELRRILSLPESYRKILKPTVIELANTVGRFFEHRDRLYFAFKPDSFDRIQHQLIRFRTCSRYLKVDSAQATEIRASAFDSQGLEYRIQYFTVKYCAMPTEATTLSSSSLSSPDLEKKEKTLSKSRRARRPPPNQQNGRPPVSPKLVLGPGVDLNLPRAPTIPEAVVQILHRIGAATGIPGYQHISALSWISALHRAAGTVGYRCLYLEALKFENWFLGGVEQGKIKITGTHNPRSRFLNTWLHGVKPEHHTAPDTETNFPDDPVPDPYAGLVRTAPD